MRPRQSFLPLALVALVVLAGCLAPIQPAGAQTATENATVAATGVGTASADPDLAVLSLAVSSFSRSADDARATTATRVDTLLTALADAGVPDDAVTTTGFSLTPQYDYSDGARDVVGYRAVHSLRVEVAPDDAGRIVDVSVGAAEVEVWSVAFTLSDDRVDELRREAIADAVSLARADAEAAAGAAGLSIDGVETIQVGSQPTVYPHFAEARAEDASTTFQPGPVTVSATVTVTYRLT